MKTVSPQKSPSPKKVTKKAKATTTTTAAKKVTTKASPAKKRSRAAAAASASDDDSTTVVADQEKETPVKKTANKKLKVNKEDDKKAQELVSLTPASTTSSSSYKIYGIKNCTTVKKACDLMTTLGHAYDFHDFKKQGIDSNTLTTWIDALGLDIVFNKNSLTYKKMSPDDKVAALKSQQTAIDAMMNNTSLIKRPVIAGPSGFLTGFDADAIRNL